MKEYTTSMRLLAGAGICFLLIAAYLLSGLLLTTSPDEPGAGVEFERPLPSVFGSPDSRADQKSEERLLQRAEEAEGRGIDRIGPERSDARAGERIVHFADEEAMQRFLERAGEGSGLRILARSSRGNALRVGFDSPRNLADALDEEDGVEYNFIASVPMPPPGEAQAGAVGFGAGTLEWLGVDSDISAMGSGVRVAVLDTGIVGHPALGDVVRSIDLVGGDWQGPADGHGVAVASLIVGKDNPAVRGLAPGAEIIDVRVADNHGRADVFTIAEGIYAAMDAGANVINISLGAHQNSAVLQRAVNAAIDGGAVIVASSGNQGLAQPAYPAAYSGVLSVGSVDARGEHLDFSNQGAQITAPGFEPFAAWSGNQMVPFSGTSGSAPLVSGAIAAAYSQPSVTSMEQAVRMVLNQANEAGQMGADPFYGHGILDAGRILRANGSGYADAAVAAITFSEGAQPWSPGRAEVLVENRGNETLMNSMIEIQGPAGPVTQSVSRLEPGEVRLLTIPVAPSVVNSGNPFNIEARVRTAPGVVDQRPDNNARRLTVGGNGK